MDAAAGGDGDRRRGRRPTLPAWLPPETSRTRVSGPQPLCGTSAERLGDIVEDADAGVGAPVGDPAERSCSRGGRRRAGRPRRRGGCGSAPSPSRLVEALARRQPARRAASPSRRSRSSTGGRGCPRARRSSRPAGVESLHRLGPAIDHVDEGGHRQAAVGAAHAALLGPVGAGRAAAAAEIDRHRPRPLARRAASACAPAPARRPRSRRRRSAPARRRSRRPTQPRRESATRSSRASAAPGTRTPADEQPGQQQRHDAEQRHPLHRRLPPLPVAHEATRAHGTPTLPTKTERSRRLAAAVPPREGPVILPPERSRAAGSRRRCPPRPAWRRRTASRCSVRRRGRCRCRRSRG